MELLSVVTVGLWLLVWAGLAVAHSMKQRRCVQCGTPLGGARAVARVEP